MNLREESILLIEDEAPMREMLAVFLRGQGFHVLTADNGSTGLAVFLKHVPLLTISDLRMPVMDGLQFLQAALKERSDATIMMLTAFATLDNAVEAMKLGAYDYLTKPIDDLVNDLLKKVEIAMERARLKEQNESLLKKLQAANASLVERQKAIEMELAMGGVVQQSLLPEHEEQWDGIRYAVHHVAGGHLSGDFYDIAKLTPTRFSILMGQVFGRDVPSALLMAMIMGTLREMQRRTDDPMLIMNRANATIKRYLGQGYQNFVSAFYGIIDLEKHTLRYVSAAHPAPILAHYRDKEVVFRGLAAKGHYLGKYENVELKLEEAPLRRSDLILLYTEPVITLANQANEQFGRKRVEKILEKSKDREPGLVLNDLIIDLKCFHSNDLQGVDLAMMAVRIGSVFGQVVESGPVPESYRG